MSSDTVLSFDRCLPASESFQLLTVAESIGILCAAARRARSGRDVLSGGGTVASAMDRRRGQRTRCICRHRRCRIVVPPCPTMIGVYSYWPRICDCRP